MRSTFRQRLLTSTMLIGAAAIATPAWAQPTDEDLQEVPVQATPDAERIEDDPPGAPDAGVIVVTGSRIQRRDLTSSSPVAVVQDEEFQLSGATNVEQVLNTLPQVVPGSTGFNNNPGGGVATLQLRGLGATRSLVLVNGRRYMFYDTTQLTDLNSIPQFLIDSVDVVTGGASAVYGSDAIAGVVNFRLQSDLRGVEAGTHYAITDRGDGRRWGGHLAIGADLDDGRGNVVAYGEYYKRADVFQGDRDFSRFAAGDACIVPGSRDRDTGVGTLRNFNTPNCPGNEFGLAPLGSSTVTFGRLNYAGGANFNNAAGQAGAFDDVVFPQPGVARPRTGADTYNYAPVNYLMVPQERWLLGGYGEYEITPAIQAFTEVSFVNNRVANELAATPVTGFFNLDVDQACGFLSASACANLRQLDTQETAANAADGETDDPGVVNTFVQRRVIETGPRNALDERNAFRVLGGLKGDITPTLNWEAYYFFARTRNSQLQSGNVSRNAFQAGLDGTGPVPLNIFGPNTLTPEMVDAITVPTQNSDIANLQVAQASISGTPFNLGMGADDVGFALGAEYRKVSARFIPDFALGSGDVIGFNAGAPTSGGYDVKELFGELRVPLLRDSFVHELELNGGFRYSDYSLDAVGGVWTYFAGAQFAPIRDITFRGQYQRAVRAPNVDDLFAGQSVGFPQATDPCALASAATNPTIRDLCIATGVPANRVGTTGVQLNPQIEGLFGGNPNLQEETADTWTVGAVIQPRFIPRLNVTIDAYKIEIDDVISTLGGGLNNTLNLCYNVIQDASSPYCQAINRNPAGVISGDQFSVEILNANIGKLETQGVDFQLDYSQPFRFSLTGAGESRVNFFFLATYTDKFDITPVADLPDEVNECAGRFGNLACGEPIPEWKWSSRLSLVDGPMTLSGRWRRIGKVTDDDPDTTFFVEQIDAEDYIDVSMSFDIREGLRLTAGVNNLFDNRPTILGDNQEQANTWPNTYDVLGRDYFVSANIRF